MNAARLIPLTLSLAPFAALPAADIVKADNPLTAFLTDGASWSGGTTPGPDDTAVFDATLATPANNQHRLGGDMAWGGIRVLDPKAVNVTSGYTVSAQVSGGVHTGTLTLGAGGIDLSQATPPAGVSNAFFGVSCALRLAADQTWAVPSLAPVHDLAFSGSALRPVDFGGFTVTKTGAGRLTFNGANQITHGTLDVQGGEVFLVNTFSVTSNSASVGRLGADLTVKLAPGTKLALGKGLGTGDISLEGRLEMNEATLNLNAEANYPGAMTLLGTLDVAGGAVSTVTYGNTSTVAQDIVHQLGSALTGTGTLAFRVETGRLGDRVLLTGDNAAFAGTVELSGSTGNRALGLATSTAGSAAATWRVAADNVLEVRAAGVALGQLEGEGTLTSTVGEGEIAVGAGSFAGMLSGHGGGGLVLRKVTPGTLTLGGGGDFVGAVRVEAGRLVVNGDFSDSTAGVTVEAAGTLAGSGQVGGAVAVEGRLSPGSGTGAFSAASFTLRGGGVVEWDVTDWTGPAGTGFDALAAESATVEATSGQPVVIRVTGAPANFADAPKSFRLLTTAFGVGGFAADKFTVDASAFTAGTGTWSLQTVEGALPGSVGALELVYTPASGDAYGAWAAQNGLAGGDAAVDADPDADGLPNGLEFLLGGVPTAGPGSDSSAMLPTVTLDETHVVFVFRRTTAGAGASPSVETSVDLRGPWAPVVHGENGATETTETGGFGPGVDRVTVRVPRAGNQLHLRLRASILRP